MLRHSLQRLLGLIPTMLMLVTVAFLLIRVAPGGPFDTEKLLPPEVEANLSAKYHLDEPVLQQYFRYVSQVAVLDFGPSYHYKDWTVNELIAQSLPVSLTVGVSAMVLAFFVGTLLGIAAALRQNTRTDYSLMGFAMLGMSVPNFVIAPILILLLAVYAGWLPAAEQQLYPYRPRQGLARKCGDPSARVEAGPVTGDFFPWPSNRRDDQRFGGH